VAQMGMCTAAILKRFEFRTCLWCEKLASLEAVIPRERLPIRNGFG
jgi:hypothetical protein